MKLPLTFLEKKEKADYYLALILRNEKVTSVIFEKVGNTIKYIGHDEEFFKNTVEDAQTEEFLNVLDKVITQAETALPESIETHKTIFGLKDSWIEDNKIKKEYLDKLKKASDELSLEPIGFLASSESIINLVQKEEGAPVTAILCDIGKKYVTVSLIRAGRIVESKTSEIHQSTSYTVDTLLKHFQSPEVMPSRIILFDSEEEELTQEFISHKWSKSLPFLHLPQTSSLAEDASIKAILLGAATQMGAQLLYDSSKTLMEDIPTKIEPQEPEKAASAEISAPLRQSFSETSEPKDKTPDYVSEDSSMEYFGFVEGDDISKTPAPKQTIEEKVPDNVAKDLIDEIPEGVKVEEESKTALPVNAALAVSSFRKFLPKAQSALKKIKPKGVFSLIASGNKKLLIIPGVFVFLLLVVLYFYLFATKATVTIFVSPKEDEKTTSVVFSSTSATNISEGIISSQFVSVSEEGSVTKDASGKKDVGDKAKGTVTVFNNSAALATFPLGTTITSSNGLKFTLDSSVTVASASGDIFQGTKPGTANVKVTAGAIGQEYNLPSNTKFTIGSNSNVAAKNDNAFSGGSKKSVTVVSENDMNKLLEDLPKKLEEKARNDIKSKVSSDKTILSDFVEENLESQSFDKKEGDETNKVSLRGTVSFKAASYKTEDIIKLASSLFAPSESEVQRDNLIVDAKDIVIEKNKDVSAEIVIKAKLLPKIDRQKLGKQISGNSLQKAKNMLSNLSQVENVDISLSPNIPFFPKNLPANSKNIIINITSD